VELAVTEVRMCRSSKRDVDSQPVISLESTCWFLRSVFALKATLWRKAQRTIGSYTSAGSHQSATKSGRSRAGARWLGDPEPGRWGPQYI